MFIITDLQLIEKLAKEREDENWRFRAFLKGCDSDELDAIVHKLYSDVARQVDCQTCGNCCRKMHPVLKQADIKRLSNHLSATEDELKKQYLVADEDDDLIFEKSPCPFLKDNSCSVYEGRPDDCRSYPHLHKADIVFRLMGVVQNLGICPIVFNVYEQLKEELWRQNDFFDEDA